MNTSAQWINDYLEPPASAEEQAECLTRAGFPMESRQDVSLPGGANDVRQDIELTSNRGDCLCHLGLAREVVAVSGRRLTPPAPAVKAGGPKASTIVSVENREKDLCPLYTARIIRGVKVGPSPAWLQARLIARGDIPRNNIVDASNFVLFELGQPTHVFDLVTLKGPRIIIRRAKANEPFLPIGEGAAEVKLSEQDVVIADAERAVAIAGVKGGALTAVTHGTRDILIEAATFAPAAVRATGRRLGISSDSQYRFERGVSPGQIDFAATRLAGLILQLCGGELCDGVVSDGKPVPPQRQVTMRCERCRAVIGVPISDEQMRDILARLELAPRLERGVIHCAIPHARLDLEREIDLIEEVARIHGLEKVPVADAIKVRVASPQPTELARRAVNDAVVGMGYVETVTHSLISEQAAAAFLPPGMSLLRIEDVRAGAEPVLRPSILPSLLHVFAHNRDSGAQDVRLFETASTFALMKDAHVERVNLALLAPGGDESLREVRGAIDRLLHIVRGRSMSVMAAPQHVMSWFAPGAVLNVGNDVLGLCGMLSPSITRLFGLNRPMVGAEIGLPEHYRHFPPDTEAVAPPAFPSIERDVSVILDDRIAWAQLREAVGALKLEHAEEVEFVTVFRGQQIGAGRKSLSLRIRFRAVDRTLKHEEVDPQMQKAMDMLKATFKAEIRAQMPIENQSVGEFLEAVASKKPTPGGGAVASIVAALSAALGRMVVNFSIGKKSLVEFDNLHQQTLEALQEHGRRALKLAEDDARAYEHLNALWKLDKADPRRVEEFPAAVEAAINAPHAVLHLCMETLRLLQRLTGKTSAMLASDLAIATVLAEAGARSAAWNVRINLPLLDDEAVRAMFEQTLTQTLGDARDITREIEIACARR